MEVHPAKEVIFPRYGFWMPSSQPWQHEHKTVNSQLHSLCSDITSHFLSNLHYCPWHGDGKWLFWVVKPVIHIHCLLSIWKRPKANHCCCKQLVICGIDPHTAAGQPFPVSSPKESTIADHDFFTQTINTERMAGQDSVCLLTLGKNHNEGFWVLLISI